MFIHSHPKSLPQWGKYMRFHVQNPTVVLCFQQHTTPVCVWAGGGVDLGVSSRASAPKYRASVSTTTRRRSHITRRPRHSRPSLSRSHYRLYLASTAWHSEWYHVYSVVCLLSVHSPETWNQLTAPRAWPLTSLPLYRYETPARSLC